MNTDLMVTDKNLIAYCGLYCGACGSFLKGKCPGCKKNIKASWCKIRQCCVENDYLSCADCRKMEIMECKKFNNFISKIFGLIFHSNRPACIQRIKELGYEEYARQMATNKLQSVKRN
jgi:Protein of unknown function (DUF3795)